MSQQIKNTVKDSLIYIGVFLLLLASLFTPFSLITVWLLPLPFFILLVKQHWKVTGACGLILAVICTLIHPLLFLFVFYAFIVGSIMGRSYRNPGASGTDVLLSGIVVACIYSWLLLIIGEYFFQIIDGLRTIWNQSLQEFKIPIEERPTVETILPFLLLIVVVLAPLTTFPIGRYILSKQGYTKKYLPLFRNWRLPRVFFYFYALLIIYMLFLPSNEESPVLQGIILMLQVLFIIQGISFSAFLLYVYHKNKLWLIPIILTIFIPIFSSIILFFGLIDSSFPIREWLRAKK